MWCIMWFDLWCRFFLKFKQNLCRCVHLNCDILFLLPVCILRVFIYKYLQPCLCFVYYLPVNNCPNIPNVLHHGSWDYNWATSQEKLFLGFRDSNRPAQLQRLASLESLNLASIGIILSMKRTAKALIRLHRSGWYVPLLFAYGKNRFSHDIAGVWSGGGVLSLTSH